MKRSWYSLGVLVALTLAARCREDRIVWPPPQAAIAWDGTTYVTAWRYRDGVYVQRGDAKPRRVYKQRGQTGALTLQATQSGLLLGTAVEDERGERRQVMIPLDASGRPTVRAPTPDPNDFTADVSCVARGERGDLAVRAYLTESGEPGDRENSLLTVQTYDARGTAIARAIIVEGPSPHNCAVSTDGTTVAVAVHTQERLVVHVLDAHDLLEELVHVELPAHWPGPMWATSVARDSDGTWAVLHRDPKPPGVYQVLHVDTRGLVAVTVLREELWHHRVELGATTDRGLFFVWHDNSKETLHVEGLRSGSDFTRRVPLNAGVRAASSGPSCAATVQSQRGDVTVEQFTSCP